MGDFPVLVLPVGNALEGEKDTLHGVGVASCVMDDGVSQLGKNGQYRFADPILPRGQHVQIG